MNVGLLLLAVRLLGRGVKGTVEDEALLDVILRRAPRTWRGEQNDDL